MAGCTPPEVRRTTRATALERNRLVLVLAAEIVTPYVPQWQSSGYRVKLFFLKLESPELAIARVEQRVRTGGHNVPEAVVQRRFAAGLRNLELLYKPLVDEWALFDNSGATPQLIDEGVNA